MSFLTPLFFLGLGAIAVPILVHLIQRERKRVIEFPSLMFVQKIPYQSVRRRRIRHWFLLLMRAAAIALHRRRVRAAVPARAARRRSRRPAATASSSILLDQSASMGYGDHWQRARDAARDVDRIARHRRSRDARAVRPERRGEHPRHLRPRPARGGARRRAGHLRRDALRSGAEARREHPRAVDAAAPRSDPHLRLPEVRAGPAPRTCTSARASR